MQDHFCPVQTTSASVGNLATPNLTPPNQVLVNATVFGVVALLIISRFKKLRRLVDRLNTKVAKSFPQGVPYLPEKYQKIRNKNGLHFD